jgi:DNA-binding Lrp family transcriptional regulator
VVFCSVSLDSQKLEEITAFSEAVREIPEVLECYLMGGANDFLLKVVVADLQAYHEFSSGKLAALPNVAQIKSTFVLNEVKRSTVFPLLGA